jgi:signal transduction histidine kinase/CheY-like chemotaxis protein/CHASE1-domain containing sensor protein/HPt (histidine-containing phosphotransfer) domain-containing protein
MADIASRNTGKTAAPWAGGLVLALLAGAGLYASAAHTVDTDAQARFEHLAHTGSRQLEGTVDAYADVVRGLAALFEANGGTATRLQFHRYVEALGAAEHYPAIESINYAAYVEDSGRDAFVAAVRADRSLAPSGYPEFSIRSAVHRPAYTVLTYLDPLLPEKFGVDLSGGAPAIAQTLAKARDSGRVAASGKPIVVEHPVRHLGLGLRMPVYRMAPGSSAPRDVEGRRAAYAGSVGIGFSIPALVRGALQGGEARPVALQLYAAADSRATGALRVNGADSLLYDGAGPAPADGGALLEAVLPVRFDDNLWKARFVARRADLAGTFGRVFPWLAGAGGFGATLLVYALFLNLARSRRAAVKQRRLLDLVLDNVDAYVYLKDRDRRYLYVNAKMAAACGRPQAEIVGRCDHEVMPKAAADALWALDRPVLELGEKRAVPNPFAGSDGVVRQLWSVKVPVRFDGNGDGGADAVLCVSTDVTELHALKAKADAASRAKSDFLSNMSHEIRTPMNSIIGMAYLAARRAEEPKQRDYLDKIHHAAQHLLGIINHILDFSSMEAGKVELELLDFTLEALTRSVAGQLGAQAAARGLVLAFDVDPELQRPLRGDPLRLEQVLVNLVGNAIKFSERGKVHVRASVERTVGADLLVRFDVEDNGIGIRPDDLARLFAPFEQVDPSPTRRHGGTGLGLVISKQIVELLHGTISATSTPGRGSTFRFTVPLKVVPAAHPAAAPEQPGPGTLDGLAILLVEDNAFNQLVAREVLEEAGARVVVAGDGAEALARLAEHRVDCVLMDVQMPVMDGIEATRRLRADRRFADLKVIALTANASLDDQARCLAAGMDAFLTKPAAPDTLVATIARTLGLGVPRPPAGCHETGRPGGALLDLGVLSDAFEGQPERMRKYAFLFVDAARDGLHEIDRALAAQEPARAAAVAHRLKSAARTVGALGFGDVCADLERQVEPGALGHARTLAARLRGLLSRLERHILAELGARAQDHQA